MGQSERTGTRSQDERAALEKRAAALGPWFYEFDLGGGLRTECKIDKSVAQIHETRREMVEAFLRERYGARLAELRALDLGCHEGYFSSMLAELGVPDVVGVDIRPESLAKASFVAEAQGHSGLSFVAADCEELARTLRGSFDVCLCLGLLYHLENPMRCLRQAAALTRDAIVVETQVVDELEGSTEWGRKDLTMPYRGVLALIDESSAFRRGNAEAGATPVALCPSPRAVHSMLAAVGFGRTRTLIPPANAYEQLARGKRIVVAGWRE
jgi:SAM-dependent methyltransferase